MMESEVANTQSDSHNASLISTWAILVVLTLTSWWFKDHDLRPDAAITLVLIISFVKVFMVGHSFMEIGRSPRLMRAIFATWCALICTALLVLALAL